MLFKTKYSQFLRLLLAVPLKKHSRQQHKIHFMYQSAFATSVTLSGDKLFSTSQITDTRKQHSSLIFFFFSPLRTILTFCKSTFQSFTKLYRIQFSRFFDRVTPDYSILFILVNTENILVKLLHKMQ